MEKEKQLADLDLMTDENIQHFVKLIFFKENKADRRWHITLGEFAEIHFNQAHFRAFCGLLAVSAIDTQNRKRLFEMMDSERSEFCERCAEEFVIAEPALRAKGYLEWKK